MHPHSLQRLLESFGITPWPYGLVAFGLIALFLIVATRKPKAEQHGSKK